MLERIKLDIEEAKSDNTTFYQQFVRYMMEVQDANIESEMGGLFRRTASVERTKALVSIDKLVASEQEGMILQ